MECDDRGGQAEAQVINYLAALLVTASELAEAVHPRVTAVDHPSLVGPDRGGHALAGDLAGGAEFRSAPV
jgi:hypothetical protein